MLRNGYTDFLKVQNKSGHGVDILARKAGGRWEAFEVKASRGFNAPGLSSAQSGGATSFTNSRLSRALGTSSTRNWKGVNPRLQSRVQEVKDEMKPMAAVLMDRLSK